MFVTLFALCRAPPFSMEGVMDLGDQVEIKLFFGHARHLPYIEKEAAKEAAAKGCDPVLE